MRLVVALISVGLMAVVFFLAFFITTSPIWVVNSCANITDSGYYYLNTSVSGAPYAVSPFSGGICIAIQSDNVTFDCKGHNVTNNGTTGLTAGIVAIGPYENVTIMNCPSISGYQYGAGLDGVEYSAIINVTAHDNGDAGIYIARAGGDNNLVTNCTAYGHHSGQFASDGFYMHSGSSNTFVNNTAYDNDYGFDIRSGASNTNMSDNIAYDNDRGFYIQSNSNLNNLDNNTAYENDYGFYLSQSDNDVLTDNIGRNNTVDGFRLLLSDGNNLTDNTAYGNTEHGIHLVTSSNNDLFENTAYDNDDHGIFAKSNSHYNDLVNNTAYQNGNYGFCLFLGSENNTLQENEAYDNERGFYIASASYNNLTGDEAHNNVWKGFQFEDSDYLSLEGLVSYENEIGFDFNATNYGYITNSIAHNNTDYGFLMVFGGINHFNFTHNHALDNEGKGFAGGNGESSEALFYNNTAANNSEEGFFLTNTGDVYLVGNRLLENDGYGVSVEGTTGARIVLENNTAWQNGQSGFYLETGEGLFFNNTADSNDESGFVFDGLFGGYPVANNTASNNQDHGFYVLGFPTGVLANNTAYGNEVGFTINSDSNNVSDNDAYSNNNGFYVNSDLSTFTGNTAYDNTWSGFSVSTCSDSNFTDNTAYNNSDGFSLTEVSGVLLTSNTVFNNTDGGIYINTADGLVFIDNLIYNNSGIGLELEYVENSNLTDNEVYDNSYGFYVSDSSYNDFTNNWAYNNSNSGFSIFTSDDTELANDTANNNGIGTHIWDSDGTVISGIHYFDNTVDFMIDGTAMEYSLVGVIFDSPAGNLVNYTNLSVNDTLLVQNVYSMDHATAPPSLPSLTSSFKGKFVDITNYTSGVLIDSIVWHWQENETANYTESLLNIWEYTTSWTMLSATRDSGANTLSLTDLEPHSVFAMLETTPPDDDDGGDEEPAPLSVSFESLCEENTVTVTSRGNPVSDAKVVVDLVTSIMVDYTDGDGQVSFESYPAHCSKTVTIQVSKKDYDKVSISRVLLACELCIPEECTTNDDCPDNELCLDGECVPVECTCGVIENHACIGHECCADDDCPEDQECVGHSCQEIPVYECASDNDCADTELCSIAEGEAGGSCTAVTGCGDVVDHVLVPYECGDEPECLPCEVGACIEHRCVTVDLTGPDDGFVGDEVSLIATQDGKAYANSVVEITDPTGKTFTGRTDENGNLELPLNLKGRYEILLTRDGEPVALKTVNALAKPPVTEEKPLTAVIGELLSSLWWLIVALAIVAIVVYLSRRGRKRKK